MERQNIRRGASVFASDGEVGRVTHVVVDRQTREVTDIVVEHDGREQLIPISAVAAVEGGRVVLRADRSQLRGAPFDRDQFHGVDDEAAADESRRRADRGGAPLIDANDDAVAVGGLPATSDESSFPGNNASHVDADRSLQLREEELQVHKELIEVGGVLFRKEIVSEPKTLEVLVTRDEVVIERHAVDPRPADRPIGETETIAVPVREERVTVEKRPVVAEEVRVGKRTAQDRERVSETVRREEVVIDAEGDVDIEPGAGGPGRDVRGSSKER